MATDQEIPTDQVKGVRPGDEGFLKERIDGVWQYRKDAHKEGKTSSGSRKSKPGQVEKPVKKRSRLKPCTRKMLLKARERYPQGDGIRVLRALYRHSLFRQKRDDKYYNGTATQSGRYYSWGQEWLAKRVKMTRRNVRKWLTRFKADGFICVRYHGYVNRGASILELAYNEEHRRFLQGENKKQAERLFT